MLAASLGVVAVLLAGGLPLTPHASGPTPAAPPRPGAGPSPLEPAATVPVHSAEGTAGVPDSSPVVQPYDLWTDIPTPVAPSPRAGAMIAYDARDGYLLLFGGGDPGAAGGWYELGDTWTFSGTTWTNITGSLATAPSPRSDGAMVYDPAAQEIVLFGGQTGPNGTTLLNDTWTYSGGTWTQLSPSSGPPPRTDAAMTWDNASGEAVLFGGCADSNCSLVLNDTWTYSAGSWTNVTAGPSPAARGGADFSYDAVDGYDLLFGGVSPAGRFNDSWSFHDGNWTNLTAAVAPPARTFALSEYDPALELVVLYGGENAGVLDSDTWSYRASAWTGPSPATWQNPGPTARTAMVYDPGVRTIVLFGGLSSTASADNATWELSGSPVPALIGVSVLPVACGPLEIGSGVPISSGNSTLVGDGNYTVVAPPCGGGVFSHWSTSGGLSIAAGEDNASAATLAVEGSGDLGAYYVATFPVSILVQPKSCGPISIGPLGPVGSGQLVYLALGEHTLAALTCPSYAFEQWTLSGNLTIPAGSIGQSGTEVDVRGLGTLEAVYVPLESVGFAIAPASCGPIEVSTGAFEANGGSLALPNGTYLITAPACSGHVFDLWTVSGGLSIPAGLSNVSGAELLVAGPGTLTATYLALNTVLFAVTPSSCGLDSVATPSGVIQGGPVALANGTYLAAAPSCVGYEFDHWATLGAVTISTTATFSPNAPVQVLGSGSVTAVFTPLYSIQFVVQPTSCGAVRVGANGQVVTSGVALLANGSYLIEAPACAGYYFQSWETAGDVSVPAAEAGNVATVLAVTGIGIVTAVFDFNLTVPPTSPGSSSSWYSVTPFGIVLGVIAGVAVGAIAVFAILRARRPPHRPRPAAPHL